MQGILYRIFLATILLVLLDSCSMTLAVKDGRSAYELKQYAKAVTMLTEEYENENKTVKKQDIAYLLGKSYDYMGDYSNSLRWLQSSGGEAHSLVALRDLGYAYKKNKQYASARKCFSDLLQRAPGDPRFTQEVFVLKSLVEEEKNKDKYKVDLHPASSIYNDFAPILFDENHILISSDRSGGVSNETYQWTGNSFSDFYLVNHRGISVDGSLVNAINTEENEGSGCFNHDFTEFYFTRCGKGEADNYCRIYQMRYIEDTWTDPAVLAFQVEKANYGHPTLIEGGEVLVFSADIEASRGGRDLFFSERIYNTDSTSYEWSEASALPQTLNTEGNEVFPVGYNDTLYYSSDGMSGRGGLDIFKTYLTNGRWAAPKALDAPINSEADDMSFIIDTARIAQKGMTGYFASNRRGMGGDDIYRFGLAVPLKEIEEVVIEETEEEVEPISFYLAVQTVTPTYAVTDDPNSNIVGYEPIRDVNLRVSVDNGMQIGSTDADGRWIRELNEASDIRIRGSKNGFFDAEVSLEVDNVEDGSTVNARLVLNPVFLNTEITLENILYDYNKWDIRDDAKPSLDSLVTLMNLNSNMEILLSSHTDCRGEEAYNLILSQKRAQSAVDYLIQAGISRRRVKAKGYGESNPKVTCVCEECSEEDHQANRRTAFTILRMN